MTSLNLWKPSEDDSSYPAIWEFRYRLFQKYSMLLSPLILVLPFLGYIKNIGNIRLEKIDLIVISSAMAIIGAWYFMIIEVLKRGYGYNKTGIWSRSFFKEKKTINWEDLEKLEEVSELFKFDELETTGSSFDSAYVYRIKGKNNFIYISPSIQGHYFMKAISKIKGIPIHLRSKNLIKDIAINYLD